MLRRSLLTSAIAASLLTTFSLPAFATQVYETDLVIIGGGLSGLAAAQSALTKALNRSSSKKKLPWAAAETSLKEVLASAPVIRRNTTSTPPLTRFLLPLCSTITIALTRTSFVF